MQIVDRANGSVLLEVPDDQGELLTDLVEDVQSFQVSELFLDVAAREGLESTIVELFRTELEKSPTLFVGTESSFEGEGCLRLAGQLLDHEGAPLGGLVVTAQNKDEDAVAWAYSRPDGHFSLSFARDPQWTEMDLLVSGRGGLLLSSFELDELHDGVERLEPFRIMTAWGTVKTESGSPLSGGRVEAWSTWAVLDTDGRFCLPVDRLGEELHLELFATSGQPLGGYWTVSLPAAEPVDLGERTVPDPTPDWPDSEEPLIAQDYSVDPIFPGVSDHPLGG